MGNMMMMMYAIVANTMEQCSLLFPLQTGAGPMALMLA
jgi:hypothetical protein